MDGLWSARRAGEILPKWLTSNQLRTHCERFPLPGTTGQEAEARSLPSGAGKLGIAPLKSAAHRA